MHRTNKWEWIHLFLFIFPLYFLSFFSVKSLCYVYFLFSLPSFPPKQLQVVGYQKTQLLARLIQPQRTDQITPLWRILGTIHILRKQRGWVGEVGQMLTFSYMMGGWLKANAYFFLHGGWVG